jgi:hypothetical protein
MLYFALILHHYDVAPFVNITHIDMMLHPLFIKIYLPSLLV